MENNLQEKKCYWMIIAAYCCILWCIFTFFFNGVYLMYFDDLYSAEPQNKILDFIGFVLLLGSLIAVPAGFILSVSALFFGTVSVKISAILPLFVFGVMMFSIALIAYSMHIKSSHIVRPPVLLPVTEEGTEHSLLI